VVVAALPVFAGLSSTFDYRSDVLITANKDGAVPARVRRRSSF